MNKDDAALHDFTVMSGARLRCGACAAIVAACDVEVTAVLPIDGNVDPQHDSMLFVALCPICRASGAVVACHGRAASDDDQAVLAALGQYARNSLTAPK